MVKSILVRSFVEQYDDLQLTAARILIISYIFWLTRFSSDWPGTSHQVHLSLRLVLHHQMWASFHLLLQRHIILHLQILSFRLILGHCFERLLLSFWKSCLFSSMDWIYFISKFQQLQKSSIRYCYWTSFTSFNSICRPSLALHFSRLFISWLD